MAALIAGIAGTYLAVFALLRAAATSEVDERYWS